MRAVGVVSAVVAILAPVAAAAATPSTGSSLEREKCSAGVISVQLRSASVKVTDKDLVKVDVDRAGGAFLGDAKVRLDGQSRSSVWVKADACPGGVSNPAAETRAVAWTGEKTGAVKNERAGTHAQARKAAVSGATDKAKEKLRDEATERATVAAKEAAMESSRAGGDTPMPTPTPTPVPTPTPEQLEAFRVMARDAVIRYTNDARTAVGVSPLTSLWPVTGGAQRWAQQMTDNGVLGHDTAMGVGNNPGVEACSSQTTITEIAAGFTAVPDLSAESANDVAFRVVEAWKNSPGHYSQLVSGNYSRTGVGIGMVPAAVAGWFKIGVIQRPWGGSCPEIAY